jgi:hypothetical protein
MIDPLETALLHIKNDSDLATAVGGRVTAKTKFAMEGVSGGAWAEGSSAITGELMSATADLYGGTIPFRLAVRCWGKDQQDAMTVWRELHRVLEATERTVVTLSGGDKALLYYLVTESMPEMGYDETIRMDFVFVELRGAVHRDPVP